MEMHGKYVVITKLVMLDKIAIRANVNNAVMGKIVSKDELIVYTILTFNDNIYCLKVLSISNGTTKMKNIRLYEPVSSVLFHAGQLSPPQEGPWPV